MVVAFGHGFGGSQCLLARQLAVGVAGTGHIDDTTVTVVHLDTGKVIARNSINQARSYWRNTTKRAGRWPGS